MFSIEYSGCECFVWSPSGNTNSLSTNCPCLTTTCPPVPLKCMKCGQGWGVCLFSPVPSLQCLLIGSVVSQSYLLVVPFCICCLLFHLTHTDTNPIQCNHPAAGSHLPVFAYCFPHSTAQSSPAPLHFKGRNILAMLSQLPHVILSFGQ